MSPYTAVAVVNTAIVLTVGAVSFAGFYFAGTSSGLWSILMLVFFMSAKTPKEKGGDA